MALRWRTSDPSRPPEQARLFVKAHERLLAVASEAGLGHADVVTHHLGRGEITGAWEHEQLVLVVERIGVESATTA